MTGLERAVMTWCDERSDRFWIVVTTVLAVFVVWVLAGVL